MRYACTSYIDSYLAGWPIITPNWLYNEVWPRHVLMRNKSARHPTLLLPHQHRKRNWDHSNITFSLIKEQHDSHLILITARPTIIASGMFDKAETKNQGGVDSYICPILIQSWWTWCRHRTGALWFCLFSSFDPFLSLGDQLLYSHLGSTCSKSMIHFTSTWAFPHLFTMSIMLENLTLEEEPLSGSESETEEQILSPTAQSARQEQNAFFKNLWVWPHFQIFELEQYCWLSRTDSQKQRKTWPSKN